MLRSRVSSLVSLNAVGVAAAGLQQVRYGANRSKICSLDDAIHLIHSGATVTIGGFVGQNCPEEILKALGEKYRTTKEPRDLTIIFGGGPGDWATRGLNHLAQEGLLRRAIGSHYGQVPMLGKFALDNKCAAYCVPLGSLSRMIRCAAAKLPGHITKVGLGTFVDPRNGGGKVNPKAAEEGDIVSHIKVFGEDYLLFKAFPVDVAIVRGTTADEDGNISMEHESLYADNMIQAMSARSSRGVCIAQVERLTANGSLNPRNVRIPGTMVDVVVVANPENHGMSFATAYNPLATASTRQAPKLTLLPLDERKIVARRAAMELMPNQVANLGVGIPEGVASVAEEERILQSVELTTEPGVHGGVGLSGYDFGPAVNYSALIDMNHQFDFYNGGGLDICFLGMAEITANGDVNVTRVGPKLTGPGGFVDISQCTKRVNLLGTFTASGLEVACENGKLRIVKEGKIKKFIKKLPEITFSGEQAIRNGQIVNYITERAVFSLTKEGVELVEIAPGIDLKTQVLDLMEWKPKIREPLKLMNEAIFMDAVMGLKKQNFGLNMRQRLEFCKETNTLFSNLYNASLKTMEDVEEIESTVVSFIKEHCPSGRCKMIANYEGFDCREELQGAYENAVKRLESKFYYSVRRYTYGAFLKQKLGRSMGVEQLTASEYTLDEVKSFVKMRGFMISDSALENYFRHLSQGASTISRESLLKLIFKVK